MALVFMGTTPCGICGAPLCEGEDYIGFPEFLPKNPSVVEVFGRRVSFQLLRR